MQLKILNNDWSEWKKFPDPRELEFLTAPFGEGVYDLRNKRTGENVLYGRGKNVSSRMCSLLPQPLGTGSRNNKYKRNYVFENLTDIEYRCKATSSKKESLQIEKNLKSENKYLFDT